MITLPRRKFLAGLSALIAAPAIVRASSIMPVRSHRFSDIEALLDARMKLVESQFCEFYQERVFWMSNSGVVFASRVEDDGVFADEIVLGRLQNFMPISSNV